MLIHVKVIWAFAEPLILNLAVQNRATLSRAAYASRREVGNGNLFPAVLRAFWCVGSKRRGKTKACLKSAPKALVFIG